MLQMLNRKNKIRNAVFAFAVQPAFEKMEIINEEALSEITQIAVQIMEIDIELSWERKKIGIIEKHAGWSVCKDYIEKIRWETPLHKKRLTQLLAYLIANKLPVSEPEFVENEMDECFKSVEKNLPPKNRN